MKSKDENKIRDSLDCLKEESYMAAILNDETEDLMSGIINKISKIQGLEVKDVINVDKEDVGYLKLSYDNDDYEVGFYLSDFVFPDFCISGSYYFSDEEVSKIQNAKKCLTMFMNFNENARKSFHLQLKLIVAAVPNLLGVMDFSSERILPPKWALLAANSSVLPQANDLFVVQAVTDEDEVWLHTHGLCRFGIPELEILESNKKNYSCHYRLISTLASRLLDDERNFNSFYQGIYIGVLSNNEKIVVTFVPWEKGLEEYKNLKLGNVEDREDIHCGNSSLIFLYKSEEDETNKKLSKISEFDDLWGDNPIYFISKEETSRMKLLARERFAFVKEESSRENNNILVKIGISIDEDETCEHIWFRLIDFDGENFKARLTQEPYYIPDMKIGDERWYTVENVTDWIIYRDNYSITPSSVYRIANE